MNTLWSTLTQEGQGGRARGSNIRSLSLSWMMLGAGFTMFSHAAHLRQCGLAIDENGLLPDLSWACVPGNYANHGSC